MKKIKNLSRIMALLLVLTLCLPFAAACGEKTDTASTLETNDAAAGDNAENNGTPGDESPPVKNEAATDEPAPTDPPAPEPEADVPDSGTAKLLGKDFETKGDWIGKYGTEGSLIYTDDDSLDNTPSYAKIEFEDEQVWTWWDSDSGDPAHADDEELAAEREAGALYKTADKTSRIAACWYNGEYFNVTVSVGDAPKKVSLYMNDFDSYSRSAEVTVKNKNGKAMKEPAEKVFFEVDEYVAGCYISYQISGEVMFEFDCYGGNVVLSGIFFDPAP